MYPSSKKDSALLLRRKGKSMNGIAQELGISKSITSLWVRGVPLSRAQRNKLRYTSLHAGRIAFTKAAQRRHQQYIRLVREAERKGAKDSENLSQRDIFMLGLGLYWGEGYKKGSAELGFTNTDPKVIRFYVQWLWRCFRIDLPRLILRISINEAYRGRERKALRYWSQCVGVPFSQFTKTSFVKTKQKKQYTNAKTHYGTLRVKVRGGSVLRARILAALQSVP